MVKHAFSLLAIAILFATVPTQAQNKKSKKVCAMPSNNTQQIGDPYYEVNAQLSLFKENVTFYALNKEKDTWELRIKKNCSISFILNGVEQIFTYAKPAKAQDNPVTRYYSTALLNKKGADKKGTAITISIREERFKNPVTMTDYPITVDIQIEGKKSITTYNGGGFYIANPSLHDIWVLDSLNGEKVQTESFTSGLPQLEFHLDGGRVMGFGGCNQLTGTYYIVEDEIHFNPLAVTIKMCEPTNGEFDFLKALGKSRFIYTFGDLRLRLTRQDSSVIVFRKVD